MVCAARNRRAPLSLFLSIYLSRLSVPPTFCPLCSSLSLIGAYFHERSYGRTRSRPTRPPLLASGQNRGAVSVPLARCSLFHRSRSFHARAGSSYRDSTSPPLPRSFFSLCPSSLLVLPLWPIEERAGHKSGATPARDCNPTGYTTVNRAPCPSVYVYVRVFRSRPVRSTPRNGIAAIGGAIDRSLYAY